MVKAKKHLKILKKNLNFYYSSCVKPNCGCFLHPTLIACMWMQYLPHALHSKSHVLERFAVIFSVAIVWLYAYFLTLGGAYNHSPPRTRLHCRTDGSGLVSAAPWYDHSAVHTIIGCFMYIMVIFTILTFILVY